MYTKITCSELYVNLRILSNSSYTPKVITSVPRVQQSHNLSFAPRVLRSNNNPVIPLCNRGTVRVFPCRELPKGNCLIPRLFEKV